MKKIAFLTLLVAAAGLLNTGCSASASVRKADNSRPSSTTQVAYTSAPVKGK